MRRTCDARRHHTYSKTRRLLPWPARRIRGIQICCMMVVSHPLPRNLPSELCSPARCSHEPSSFATPEMRHTEGTQPSRTLSRRRIWGTCRLPTRRACLSWPCPTSSARKDHAITTSSTSHWIHRPRQSAVSPREGRTALAILPVCHDPFRHRLNSPLGCRRILQHCPQYCPIGQHDQISTRHTLSPSCTMTAEAVGIMLS